MFFRAVLRFSVLVISLLMLNGWVIAQPRLPLPANATRGGSEIPLESFPPFIPSDGADMDQIGAEMALVKDLLVIGAPYADHHGMTNAGAIYIYRPDVDGNWIQTQKIVSNAPQSGEYFGQSVAIVGEGDSAWILVGGPNYADFKGPSPDDNIIGTGKAYLLKPIAGVPVRWSVTNTILSPQQILGGSFGYSLDIWKHGSTVAMLIGAPFEESLEHPAPDDTSPGGAVHYYQVSGGAPVLIQTIRPPESDRYDLGRFGFSVSHFQDSLTPTLMIAAPFSSKSINFMEEGRVYIYHYTSSYIPLNTLDTLTPDNTGLFGYTVEGYDDGAGNLIAAVGAIYEDDGLQDAGHVHLYTGTAATGFITAPTILSANPAVYRGHFGVSIDIADIEGKTRMLVGAASNDTQPGSAYLLVKDSGTWSESEILSGDETVQDYFGFRVALSETDGGRTLAFIGAPRGRLTPTDSAPSGIIYRFERAAPEIRLTVAGGLPMVVSESGPYQGEFTLVLATPPTDPVNIMADIAGDECGFADISSRADSWSFDFNDSNWSIPQLVGVVGVDDGDIEGPHTCPITFTVTTIDPVYNAFTLLNIDVLMLDDELVVTELVRNLGMETPVPGKPQKPQNWVFKNLVGADKRICPGASSPLVYTGNCSVQFGGNSSGPRAVLRSTRNKADLIDTMNINLTTDDTVRVQFAYKLSGPHADPLMRLVAFRNFGGDRTVLARIELPHPSEGDYDEWLYFDQSFTLTTTDFKQLRLILKDFSKQGKWWVDDVSLIYHDLMLER